MRTLTIGIASLGIAATLGLLGRTSLTAAGPDDRPDDPEIVIKNEFEGRTTIHYLVSNGRHVRKGGLLVIFDPLTLRDRLDLQVFTTRRAEAVLEQAQMALKCCKLNLRDYQERTYPEDRALLKKEVARAQAALDRADERLKAVQVADKDPSAASRAERDRDRARLDLRKARRELEILETVTRPFIVDRLSADIEAAEAEIPPRQAVVELEQARETMLQQRADQVRITSPVAGKVILARIKGEDVQENTLLRQGQEVLRVIPDRDGETP